MTLLPDAHPPTPPQGPPRLVIVAIGPAAELVVLQQQAALRLARLTGLNLRPITPVEDPDRALAALHGAEPEPSPPGTAATGWLAPLPLDVALALTNGGSWALALAAWRQPCLLLIDGRQPTSGLATAATALLRHCDVPLLGLVQWSGAWDAEARRRDCLPWLGWLEETERPDGGGPDGSVPDDAVAPEGFDVEEGCRGEEAADALLPALRLRWRQLQAA